jgi:hypothetical protein
MEQGGFGGRYETVMSSGGSCRTTGFRPAHVRFGLSPRHRPTRLSCPHFSIADLGSAGPFDLGQGNDGYRSPSGDAHGRK